MLTRLMQVHEQRSGDKPVLPQSFYFCHARLLEITPMRIDVTRREIWEWRDHTTAVIPSTA